MHILRCLFAANVAHSECVRAFHSALSCAAQTNTPSNCAMIAIGWFQMGCAIIYIFASTLTANRTGLTVKLYSRPLARFPIPLLRMRGPRNQRMHITPEHCSRTAAELQPHCCVLCARPRKNRRSKPKVIYAHGSNGRPCVCKTRMLRSASVGHASARCTHFRRSARSDRGSAAAFHPRCVLRAQRTCNYRADRAVFRLSGSASTSRKYNTCV